MLYNLFTKLWRIYLFLPLGVRRRGLPCHVISIYLVFYRRSKIIMALRRNSVYISSKLMSRKLWCEVGYKANIGAKGKRDFARTSMENMVGPSLMLLWNAQEYT